MNCCIARLRVETCHQAKAAASRLLHLLLSMQRHGINAGDTCLIARILLQAEVRASVPLVTAKHSLRAHEDVWIVPHAVNASRPALHAALTGNSSVRSTVAELLAVPEDTTCAVVLRGDTASAVHVVHPRVLFSVLLHSARAPLWSSSVCHS